jgi:hypothetical protein
VHKKQLPAARGDESGNVLFFILIAVALLAALSIAITQGSRDSSSGVTADKQRLLASEIIDYGDTVQKAVAMLRLRGVTFDALRFATTALGTTYGTAGAAPTNEVFNIAGGGVIYKDETPDAMAAPQSYVFTAGNEVTGVGTTCAGDSCTDLLILLPGINQDVCMEINALIGIDNPAGAPPVETVVDKTPFVGVATYAQTIGNGSLSGKTAACFFDTGSSNYTYYQVLMPR